MCKFIILFFTFWDPAMFRSCAFIHMKYIIAKSTVRETNSWFCGIVTTLENQFKNFEKLKKNHMGLSPNDLLSRSAIYRNWLSSLYNALLNPAIGNNKGIPASFHKKHVWSFLVWAIVETVPL